MQTNPRLFPVVMLYAQRSCLFYLRGPSHRAGIPTPIGRFCVLIVAACSLIACGKQATTEEAVVRIDAAASIAHVIEGMAVTIHDDLGVHIEVNSGASGTLAQQVMQGDKADIFISADPIWVDRLAKNKLINELTRVSLVANQLVVIGRADMATRPGMLEDLSQKIFQPIAVGDPAYVPAGRYAMQAMKSHGLEREQGLKLAEAPNVRAALAYVKSGQCPVGLVYASDAHGETSVVVLLAIDPTDHDPIIYPAVILADAPEREQAVRVLNWLCGDLARRAFDEAGFIEP